MAKKIEIRGNTGELAKLLNITQRRVNQLAEEKIITRQPEGDFAGQRGGARRRCADLSYPERPTPDLAVYALRFRHDHQDHRGTDQRAPAPHHHQHPFGPVSVPRQADGFGCHRQPLGQKGRDQARRGHPASLHPHQKSQGRALLG